MRYSLSEQLRLFSKHLPGASCALMQKGHSLTQKPAALKEHHCPVCRRSVNATPDQHIAGHYDTNGGECPASYTPFRIAIQVDNITPNNTPTVLPIRNGRLSELRSREEQIRRQDERIRLLAELRTVQHRANDIINRLTILERLDK